MAISFDEKKGESGAKIKFTPTKVFWALVEVLVILLLIFGGIKIYQSSIQKNTLSLKGEIESLNAKKDSTIEGEMKSVIESFEKIEPLLNSHIRASKVFTILENDTYADAQISNFSFDANEATLTLSITSPNAQALAMQTSLFKLDPNVKEVEIGGFSFSKEGMNFQLKVTLDPKAIKY